MPGGSTYLRCTKMETPEKEGPVETQVHGLVRMVPFRPVTEVVAAMQDSQNVFEI